LNTCIHCKASLAEGQRPREPEFDLAAFRWRVFLLMVLLGFFAGVALMAGRVWIAAILTLGLIVVAVGAMFVVEHECPDEDRGLIELVLLFLFGGA
jgi:fatty acid desaturase